MSRSKKIFFIEIPEKIYSYEEILSIRFSDIHLDNLIRYHGDIKFAAMIRLINNTSYCENSSCEENQCHLVKRASIKDGFIWMCSKCQQRKSIRTGSWTMKSKLPIYIIIKVLTKISLNKHQNDIAFDLSINKKTIAFWESIVKSAYIYRLGEINEKIGGLDENSNPIIVEIDESLFFKRKYNRGKKVNGTWVIGGVERNNSKRIFLNAVPNRNRETIKEVIERNVAPGSHVITDEWRAYSAYFQNNLNYIHSTINHAQNFVDPDNPLIHTQTIEGRWSLIKKSLRRRNGFKNEFLERLLTKYTFESRFNKYELPNQLFILLISSNYEEYFDN